MLLQELKTILEQNQNKARSAWDKGVWGYAVEMVENIESDSIMRQEPDASNHDVSDFLNHVEGRGLSMTEYWDRDDWSKVRRLSGSVSWGGNFEIFDDGVVERLCTPSEIRRYNAGRMQNGPRSGERWLDVQARAVNSAVVRIHNILRDEAKRNA